MEKAGEGYWLIRHKLEEALGLPELLRKAEQKERTGLKGHSHSETNEYGMPPLKGILEDITSRINKAINKKQLIAAFPEADDSIERIFNEPKLSLNDMKEIFYNEYASNVTDNYNHDLKRFRKMRRAFVRKTKGIDTVDDLAGDFPQYKDEILASGIAGRTLDDIKAQIVKRLIDDEIKAMQEQRSKKAF